MLHTAKFLLTPDPKFLDDYPTVRYGNDTPGLLRYTMQLAPRKVNGLSPLFLGRVLSFFLEKFIDLGPYLPGLLAVSSNGSGASTLVSSNHGIAHCSSIKPQ